MTTEQPGDDPFRKQEPPASPPPPQGGAGTGDGGPRAGSDPYAGGDPYARDPYGSGPYGGQEQGGQAAPGGPYGYPQDSPYGAYGTYGEPDPLAGMPPLASRGRRLVARIVDAIVVGVPVAVVLGLAQGDVTPDSGTTFAQSLVYQLVYLVYEALMLTRSGQTVGKRLMRVRVAMLQNGAVPKGSPGWFRAAVYSLPALVPCIGSLFWLVNVLFCTWDRPYRQCLHDKAAKTVVVSTEQ